MSIVAIAGLAVFLNGLTIWELLLPGQFEGNRAIYTATMVFPILFLFFIRMTRRLEFNTYVFIMIVLCQFFIAIMGLVISDFNPFGVEKVGRFSLFVLIPFVFIVLLFRNKQKEIIILFLFMAVLSLLPFFVLASRADLSDVLAGTAAYSLRVTGYDVIGLSRSLGMGGLIAFNFFLQKHGAAKKLSWLMVSIGFLSGQIILWERGPFVINAVVMGLLVYNHLVGNIRILKKSKHILSLALSFVLILVVLQIGAYFLPRLQIDKILNDDRLFIMRRATYVGLTHPVFGKGTGSFMYSYPVLGSRMYSHNIFLELFSENGVLGVMVFFGFVGFVIRRILVIHMGLRPKIIGYNIAVALFIYYFINAQVSGDIANNYMVWITGAFVYCLTIRHKKIETFSAVEARRQKVNSI